jgi:hypothetical protein
LSTKNVIFMTQLFDVVVVGWVEVRNQTASHRAHPDLLKDQRFLFEHETVDKRTWEYVFLQVTQYSSALPVQYSLRHFDGFLWHSRHRGTSFSPQLRQTCPFAFPIEPFLLAT